MNIIEVEELTRKFGHLIAADHLTFSVKLGEIFGLLGLNGAGKTTTVLMLATLLQPTRGTARVCGLDVLERSEEVRKAVGLVFEEPSVDIYLTGFENLDFHARMYGLTSEERRRRTLQALELVGLSERKDSLVKEYSGGMVRRLEIARAMLNRPQVLFLDEPTKGLDVQTRQLMWRYVKELNAQAGTTVFLTTSYLEEADQLCHRVAIIDRGKLKVVGMPEALKDSLGRSLISLKLSRGSKEEFLRLITNLEWVNRVDERDGLLEISVRGGGMKIPEFVRFVRERGFGLCAISSRRPSLGDVLLHYVGREADHGERD